MATGIGARIQTRTNGVKTILPGAPGSQPMQAIMDSFIYEAAQVEDIVINEADDRSGKTGSSANVGRVKIRFVNTEKGAKGEDLPWADPLFPYQSTYPLIGEYVLVCYINIFLHRSSKYKKKNY